MRVLPAGLRAILIDRAGVVGLQKRAGELLQYPVAVFVEAQVARLEVRRFEPQPLGHAFLVALGPERASGFAAVGAAQAVGLGEHLLVQPVHHLVEVARGLPLQAL